MAVVVSPTTFNTVRNIPENQSIPAKIAILSVGRPKVGTTMVKATKPPPGTTTVPRQAITASTTIFTKANRVKDIPYNWVKVKQARAKYMASPLLFKAMPKGNTSWLIDWLTPRRACASSSSTGRAMAEDVVVKAIKMIRVNPLIKPRNGTLAYQLIKANKPIKNTKLPNPKAMRNFNRGKIIFKPLVAVTHAMRAAIPKGAAFITSITNFTVNWFTCWTTVKIELNAPWRLA